MTRTTTPSAVAPRVGAPSTATRPPGPSSTARDVGAPPSRRRAAIVAGTGYVAIFALAVFANFVVIEGMVVDGDPAATVAAIAAGPGTFRLGIVAFLVVAVVDVVVAWALHVLLRDGAPDRSLLGAWLRVLHTVFLAAGLASLAEVARLVETAPSAAATPAAVAAALGTFDALWMIGLAFFGLHLVVVATLLGGDRAAPRVLRGLLVVAGIAYVVDTLLRLGLTDYPAMEAVLLPVVAVPSVLGEGWLGGWLLLRAGRSRRPTSPTPAD